MEVNLKKPEYFPLNILNAGYAMKQIIRASQSNPIFLTNHPELPKQKWPDEMILPII
jgi:hypothetical protein